MTDIQQRTPVDVAAIVSGLHQGSRRALARAITELSNGTEAGHMVAAQLRTPESPGFVVGITGPPGAGKSTLIAALTDVLVARGQRVAALLIDPSSPLTGGALLGDRLRFPAITAGDEVYIRSLGGHQRGSLSTGLREISMCLQIAGYGITLLETVGSGQADVDVAALADCTILALPPGLGDSIQTLKAGIQELADIFVVTKGDRPGADQVVRELRASSCRQGEPTPRLVFITSAAGGDGADALADEIIDRADNSRAPSRGAPPQNPRPPATTEDPDQHRSAGQLAVASMFDFTGRVAVVTGASSGLGRRFARVLHDAGATVVAAARRLDRLAALAEELGTRLVPVQCNVAVEQDCDRLVTAALNAGGPIEVLVNGAGIGDVIAAEDEPIDQFREVIDTNLIGTFILCQRVGRVMIGQGSGSIINVTSALGLVASAPIKQAAYCASKGALVNLTRELAAQWARRGVRVNALAPGWFLSDMTEEMFASESGMDYIVRNAPIGRPGAEKELDTALLFLASPASSYLLGETLTVDGGWTIR